MLCADVIEIMILKFEKCYFNTIIVKNKEVDYFNNWHKLMLFRCYRYPFKILVRVKKR